MAEQSFEKALEELEKIVGKLEEGGESLDDSLKLFERGVKLSRFLRAELDKAEKKIEILLRDDSGELKTAPFEPDEKAPDDPPPADRKEKKTDTADSEEENNGTLPF
jgi:exodeoxyribonuclease VII small subunit